MASTSLYLDQRYTRDDGTHPIKIKVSFKSNRGFLVPLSVRVTPDQWSGNEVVRHANREKINVYIRDRRNVVINALFELEASGQLNGMSMGAVKKHIEEALGVDDGSNHSFIDHFNRIIESKAKQSTRTIYHQTLVKITAYDKRNLAFTDITFSWLKGFERFMSDAGISVNSINIHMRNVRAVINDAIAEDKAPLSCYPFRKYKLKKEQTRHRALTVAQLGKLCAYPCTETQKQYRDIFMLIFYLGGINIVDLCNLTEIRRGYIEYRRAKTGRLYRIKVEPEAMEIIERYRGRNYLLNILDRYKDYRNYLHRLNLNLRQIGPYKRVEDKIGKCQKYEFSPLFPDISTYWARHSWATIASSLNIPKETIAAVLGHGGNTVTDTYIAFSQRRIDWAIRKVIDYLNMF